MMVYDLSRLKILCQLEIFNKELQDTFSGKSISFHADEDLIVILRSKEFLNRCNIRMFSVLL